nr:hypothetical protein [uncultured Pedobacter sp.]
MEEHLQESLPLQNHEGFSRRDLLPWWIKAFCWLFMAMGVIAPLSLAMVATWKETYLSLYGISTNNPLSAIGFLLITLMLFKGFTAYALWFEKDYAFLLGKIDAVLGVVICVLVMLILPIIADGYAVTFRLEIILLVLFYRALNKKEYAWVNKEPQQIPNS